MIPPKLLSALEEFAKKRGLRDPNAILAEGAERKHRKWLKTRPWYLRVYDGGNSVR